jgi:molecular chaperone DnaJ
MSPFLFPSVFPSDAEGRIKMNRKKTNFYKLLNVDRDAEPSEIKRAYRKAVKRYHPDVTARGDEKFKQIQEAYETLSDPAKKLIYDREAIPQRKAGLKKGSPFGEENFLFSSFDEPNLFRSIDEAWYDFISDFSWGEGDRPQKRFVELLLTPSEARKGGEIALDVPFQISCSRCLGTGRIGRLICGNCRGQGEERLEKKVTVTVPPGVRDETEVRFSIQAPTHQPLELVVTIRVRRR